MPTRKTVLNLLGNLWMAKHNKKQTEKQGTCVRRYLREQVSTWTRNHPEKSINHHHDPFCVSVCFKHWLFPFFFVGELSLHGSETKFLITEDISRLSVITMLCYRSQNDDNRMGIILQTPSLLRWNEWCSKCFPERKGVHFIMVFFAAIKTKLWERQRNP